MSNYGQRSGACGRGARALFFLVASMLLVISWSGTSHAYPWMIKHGFGKCASCHTDPMGGETLTGMGRVMSDTTLSTRWDGGTQPTNNAKLFYSVEEPAWLRLGGSIRVMYALYKFPYQGQDGSYTAFPMQGDVYGQLQFSRFRVGGSLGASRVPAGSVYAKAAQITENNGDNQFNLISRSHWIGYDISDHVLVRAGRLNLPFGVRIPEHVMWTRVATRTDREHSQEHGLALDYYEGRFRGELMGILGNYQISPDKYRERGYSLYGEYFLSPHAAIGLSSLITHAASDYQLPGSPENTRQAHGLTGRIAPITPLAILIEGDALLSSISKVGYVGMLQADYELIQGLHFMATGEILDNGKLNAAPDSVTGFGKPQLGGWLSAGWFFFTHFDARVDIVVRQNTPTTLQAQMHYYF
jgi:hypothetical protein